MNRQLECLLPQPILFEVISINENKERITWRQTCKLLYFHIRSLKPKGLSLVSKLPSYETPLANQFAWTPSLFCECSEDLYVVARVGRVYKIHVGGAIWLRKREAEHASKIPTFRPQGHNHFVFSICPETTFFKTAFYFIYPPLESRFWCTDGRVVNGLCVYNNQYLLSCNRGIFIKNFFLDSYDLVSPNCLKCRGSLLVRKDNKILIGCIGQNCDPTPHLCQFDIVNRGWEKLFLTTPHSIRNMEMDSQRNCIYCIHYDSNVVTKIDSSTMEQTCIATLLFDSKPIYPFSIALDFNRNLLFITSIDERIYCLAV